MSELEQGNGSQWNVLRIEVDSIISGDFGCIYSVVYGGSGG
jgi:hypothetical protein